MQWESLPFVCEGDVLTLQGFLFQASNGEWILSNKPAMKSCCAGTSSKKSQVALIGDFSHFSTNTLLQVKGTIHSSLSGSYVLSDAEVIQKTIFPIWPLIAFIGCVILSKLKRLLLP